MSLVCNALVVALFFLIFTPLTLSSGASRYYSVSCEQLISVTVVQWFLKHLFHVLVRRLWISFLIILIPKVKLHRPSLYPVSPTTRLLCQNFIRLQVQLFVFSSLVGQIKSSRFCVSFLFYRLHLACKCYFVGKVLFFLVGLVSVWLGT